MVGMIDIHVRDEGYPIAIEVQQSDGPDDLASYW